MEKGRTGEGTVKKTNCVLGFAEEKNYKKSCELFIHLDVFLMFIMVEY